MPIGTDFVPFATGPGANIVSQASYVADPLTGTGNQPGIARSNVNNKALRQGTFVAAGVCQFITEQLSLYVFDDANLENWVTEFRNALLTLQPRTILHTATTFYVSNAGNDGNDGLTSGTAWATLQHASDTIVNHYDANGQTITINIATGTYAGFTQSGNPLGIFSASQMHWLGNAATPDLVSIQSSSLFLPCVGSTGAYFTIEGAKLTTTGGAFTQCVSCSNAGVIVPKNIDFGSSTGSQILAQTGGLVQFHGQCVISGGAPTHITANVFGTVDTASQLAAGELPFVFLVQGTPTFSVFVEASQGNVFINPSIMTYSGAAHGKRYQVDPLGVINTQGSGTSFFPGDVAGTVDPLGSYS